MSKYYGFFDKLLMRRIARALNGKKMRCFEADNPVSDEQKRLLTFGAVLFTRNIESCRTFKILAGKREVGEMLNSDWGIRSREEALSTVKALSTANVHTPFADDIYKTLVLKGRTAPLRPEALRDIIGLENALQSTINRTFNTTKIPEEMTDEEQQAFQEIILSELATRINAGIESYKAAREMLLDLGYSERELSWVKSTAAWDYGRAGVVARDSVKAGCMEEDEAWGLMRTAAGNAAKLCRDWREYLAGYVFGRALGYCNDSKDIYVVLRYLLNHNNSPFKQVAF